MKNFYSRHKNNKIIGGFALYAIFTLSFILIEFTMMNVLPTTFWYQWEGTEPVDDTILITDGEIGMYSYTTFKRPVTLKFTNVLHCDYNDGKGDRRIGSQQTEGIDFFEGKTTFKEVPEDHEYHGKAEVRYIWTYSGSFPAKPGICRIETKSVPQLKYNPEKQQSWISPNFEIK